MARQKSIRQAERRAAEEYLRDKKYNGRSAPEFFWYCYDLRSDFVHGGTIREAREQANAAAAALEVFVSDLLMARFADHAG